MLNSLTLPLCQPVTWIHLWVSYSFVSSIGNCKFQTFTESGHRAFIPVFYCFILNNDLEGFFPSTLLLSLSPFVYTNVENCEYLWNVWAQIYHSVTLFSLHYFLIFYFSYWKKQYSCYFYILHLSILAINKKWKWMFLCVLSTDKSPTHILPLVHVSFILYCSFGFCGQLHFQNGHHLLPSSGRGSLYRFD